MREFIIKRLRRAPIIEPLWDEFERMLAARDTAFAERDAALAARDAALIERDAKTPSIYRLVNQTPMIDRVRSKAWNQENSPVRGPEDPASMLSDEELRMLRWLAGRYYTGRGAIVDGGAFLGGSTVAFCKGLQDAGWIGRVVDSYDLFTVDAYWLEHYAPGRFAAGGSTHNTRALYDEALVQYSEFLRVHEGDIREEIWDGGDIEILFLDCLKESDINDFCVSEFFPRLIAGHSIVIQQDYLYDHLPWLHISMEILWDYFELLCDTEYNSVVFVNTKPIPEVVLRGACWSTMSHERRAAVMDRAIARWDGKKREYLVNAKRSGGLSI